MNHFRDKQPYEAYYIDFDFSQALVRKDKIISATIVVKDESNNTVTSSLTTPIRQHIQGSKVFIWVKGGISNKSYTITCKIVTLTNERYTATGEMRVYNL